MLKFEYTKLGNRYTHNNISIIQQMLSITKENEYMTDEQIGGFIKAFQNFQDALSNRKPTEFPTDFENIDLFEEDYSGPIYKFVSETTYENFIKAGKFQLGSAKYYREIERTESRDEREGLLNLIIEAEPRQLTTVLLSGFDHYIFCGTHNKLQAEEMKARYGGYLLEIKSATSFAEHIKKAIGASSFKIRKIHYSDYKCHRVKADIEDFNGIANFNIEAFKLLYKYSTFPSLFIKPCLFGVEQELRIAFSMKKDVKDKLKFVDRGILHHINVTKL